MNYERSVVERINRSIGPNRTISYSSDCEGKGDVVASFLDKHQVIDDVKRNKPQEMANIEKWVCGKALAEISGLKKRVPGLTERLTRRNLNFGVALEARILKNFSKGALEYFVIVFDRVSG